MGSILPSIVVLLFVPVLIRPLRPSLKMLVLPLLQKLHPHRPDRAPRAPNPKRRLLATAVLTAFTASLAFPLYPALSAAAPRRTSGVTGWQQSNWAGGPDQRLWADPTKYKKANTEDNLACDPATGKLSTAFHKYAGIRTPLHPLRLRSASLAVRQSTTRSRALPGAAQ